MAAAEVVSAKGVEEMLLTDGCELEVKTNSSGLDVSTPKDEVVGEVEMNNQDDPSSTRPSDTSAAEEVEDEDGQKASPQNEGDALPTKAASKENTKPKRPEDSASTDVNEQAQGSEVDDLSTSNLLKEIEKEDAMETAANEDGDAQSYVDESEEEAPVGYVDESDEEGEEEEEEDADDGYVDFNKLEAETKAMVEARKSETQPDAPPLDFRNVLQGILQRKEETVVTISGAQPEGTELTFDRKEDGEGFVDLDFDDEDDIEITLPKFAKKTSSSDKELPPALADQTGVSTIENDTESQEGHEFEVELVGDADEDENEDDDEGVAPGPRASDDSQLAAPSGPKDEADRAGADAEEDAAADADSEDEPAPTRGKLGEDSEDEPQNSDEDSDDASMSEDELEDTSDSHHGLIKVGTKKRAAILDDDSDGGGDVDASTKVEKVTVTKVDKKENESNEEAATKDIEAEKKAFMDALIPKMQIREQAVERNEFLEQEAELSGDEIDDGGEEILDQAVKGEVEGVVEECDEDLNHDEMVDHHVQWQRDQDEIDEREAMKRADGTWRRKRNRFGEWDEENVRHRATRQRMGDSDDSDMDFMDSDNEMKVDDEDDEWAEERKHTEKLRKRLEMRQMSTVNLERQSSFFEQDTSCQDILSRIHTSRSLSNLHCAAPKSKLATQSVNSKPGKLKRESSFLSKADASQIGHLSRKGSITSGAHRFVFNRDESNGGSSSRDGYGQDTKENVTPNLKRSLTLPSSGSKPGKLSRANSMTGGLFDALSRAKCKKEV